MESFEKSYDDLVYDDNFYEDNFNKKLSDDEEVDPAEEKNSVSEFMLLCEECDHQWEEMLSDDSSDQLFCPLCGSGKVVQI